MIRKHSIHQFMNSCGFFFVLFLLFSTNFSLTTKCKAIWSSYSISGHWIKSVNSKEQEKLSIDWISSIIDEFNYHIIVSDHIYITWMPIALNAKSYFNQFNINHWFLTFSYRIYFIKTFLFSIMETFLISFLSLLNDFLLNNVIKNMITL